MKGKGRAREARVVLELVPPERLNIVVHGVYAIVMTLLVLELRPPEASNVQEGLQRLQGLEPKAVAFVIGFVVAASGWAYVHQVGLLFTRSNLLHEVINLLALMLASLIPFGASIMGSFPHTFYGPATYSLIVGVLTLIYALDLALCQRTLIPPVVDNVAGANTCEQTFPTLPEGRKRSSTHFQKADIAKGRFGWIADERPTRQCRAATHTVSHGRRRG